MEHTDTECLQGIHVQSSGEKGPGNRAWDGEISEEEAHRMRFKHQGQSLGTSNSCQNKKDPQEDGTAEEISPRATWDNLHVKELK